MADMDDHQNSPETSSPAGMNPHAEPASMNPHADPATTAEEKPSGAGQSAPAEETPERDGQSD
jgi:hypothetical protein